MDEDFDFGKWSVDKLSYKRWKENQSKEDEILEDSPDEFGFFESLEQFIGRPDH